MPDPAVLLGRRPVLDRVNDLLAALAAGRGGVLWVRGEAGIGKTALLTEVGARAAARGATVLWGAGSEDTGSPAFWVWTQVLRAVADGDPGRLTTLGGPRAERSVDLVAATTPDAAAAGAGRFPLFDGVLAVLEGLADEAPVVLLLDDLHWADSGSLHLLRFLLPALTTRPVLAVCGWRDHEVLAGTDRAELAAAIAGAGESWPLGGLEAADVTTLIATTGGQHVTEDEARAVVERTGGNPLFVSEMARLAAARGSGSVSAMVPDTAQGAIRRRVARLPQSAQHALTAAAVLGADPALALVAALAGTTPAALTADLDSVLASGLVEQRGDRLVFAHALVRDAVHDAIPHARRRELHLAAADLLAPPERPVPTHLAAEVTRHLTRALPLGEIDRAVATGELAARTAHEAQAYEDAVVLYRQVLDLVPPDDPARAGLLRGVGAALLDAGDLEGARAVYREAAALARTTDDAAGLALAALGFAAGLAGFEVRLFDREQSDLLDEALRRLGDDEPVLRVHLLSRLAVALSFTDEADRIPRLVEQAVTLGRQTGDPRALGAALAAHCDAFAGPDHVLLREAEAGEVIDCARAAGDVGLELLGLRLRVIARWERGAMHEAARDVRAFTALAERLRQPLYSWYVVLWRGLAAHLAGDLEAVTRCADEVAALADPADSRNAEILGLVQRAWSLIERGATGDMMAEIMDAFDLQIELAPDGGNVIALYHGTDREVRARAVPHLPALVDALPRDKEWLPNLYAVTEGLAEGDHGGAPARHVYDLLLPYAHLFVVDGIGAGASGSVERPLGVLAMLAGDLDAGADHFERALTANGEIGPLPVANTRREYAALLARRDGPGDAEVRARQLRESRDFYAGVGILERVAEIDRLLDVPAGDTPTAAVAPDPEQGRWVRTGAGWEATFRGRAVALPAVKGMADLARLLAEPGREVHVLDLVGAAPVPRQGDLGEVLDERARAAYKARLGELDGRIADAEADGDADTLAVATEERAFLVAELTGAYGLGGRARRAGDPAERARTTVTSRIRDALGRVESLHPDLGRHLRASVRTGTFCSYQPERSMAWETSPTPSPTS